MPLDYSHFTLKQDHAERVAAAAGMGQKLKTWEMPMRLLLGGVFAGLLALALAGCQTVSSGPDAGLAQVGNAYTEAQARRRCMAEIGGGVRPVPPEILDVCMRGRMFGPSTDRWD